MSGEKIVVTGGAGFIGSHIVDLALEAGYDVSVVDDLHTGKRENVHRAARFHRVDIRDAGALEQVIAAEQPEAIIHQAAWADVRGSLEDPAGYASVNVLGSLNLLQIAQRYGVRKIIFASTGGAIYGDPVELPASEGCPPQPLDPYGASKLACEFFMDTFRHNFGLEYCALRYGNVYGPRQDPFGEAGVVAIFTGRMLRDEPAIINGDGGQQRDFTYVGDIARANLLALRAGSGIFNLGTGVPTDINTIFDVLARLTGYGHKRRHGPPKAGEVRTTYLDAAKAGRELGWQAEVALAEGLERTVEFFRSRSGA